MRRCAVFPLSVLLLAAILFSYVPLCLADDELTLTENIFGARETLSCWVDVPGRGEVRYYAQNDGLWIDLIYETPSSTKKRPFGDGGCNPTALAMAVRMLVDEKDLPSIASDAGRPYSLCNCSLNKNACGYGHARYYLTSPRDYDRFLPLVFADYACGNNTRGVRSRSSPATTRPSRISCCPTGSRSSRASRSRLKCATSRTARSRAGRSRCRSDGATAKGGS